MKKESGLDRWFKEDWVDISKKDKSGKHPPCGRSDADKGKYPKCRPSKRVTKETPKTTGELSSKEKKKAVKEKRKVEKKKSKPAGSGARKPKRAPSLKRKSQINYFAFLTKIGSQNQAIMGDCGLFAAALLESLANKNIYGAKAVIIGDAEGTGKTSKELSLNDFYDIDIFHIAIFVDGKYYDAEGETTLPQMLQKFVPPAGLLKRKDYTPAKDQDYVIGHFDITPEDLEDFSLATTNCENDNKFAWAREADRVAQAIIKSSGYNMNSNFNKTSRFNKIKNLWEKTSASVKGRSLDLVVKIAKKICPPATQDIDVNTKNRNITREKHSYGPLNPAEENDKYWKDLASKWNGTKEEAMTSRCSNCVAFDISPRMKECMPLVDKELDKKFGKDLPGFDLDEYKLEFGYCWMHHFKCLSARTCDTWASGGPIEEDETSYEWQEKNKF